MAAMTSQQLKKVLQVRQWSEIKTPQQFYRLMRHFHDLSPILQRRIVSEINDLTKMTEDFLRLCIDGIVDYEPSIMLEMMDQASEIKKAIGGEKQISKQEQKKAVSEKYISFSEWFNVDGEVQCSNGKDEIICSVSDAVEMAIENDRKEKKEPINMMLLTKQRRDLMRQQELMMLSELAMDEDFMFELFGEDAEALGFERPGNKYLN